MADATPPVEVLRRHIVRFEDVEKNVRLSMKTQPMTASLEGVLAVVRAYAECFLEDAQASIEAYDNDNDNGEDNEQ